MPISLYVSGVSILLSCYVLWQVRKASRGLDELERQIERLERNVTIVLRHQESRRR